VDIRHIPGTSNKAADTLSRLNVLERVNDFLITTRKLIVKVVVFFGDDDITQYLMKIGITIMQRMQKLWNIAFMQEI